MQNAVNKKSAECCGPRQQRCEGEPVVQPYSVVAKAWWLLLLWSVLLNGCGVGGWRGMFLDSIWRRSSNIRELRKLPPVPFLIQYHPSPPLALLSPMSMISCQLLEKSTLPECLGSYLGFSMFFFLLKNNRAGSHFRGGGGHGSSLLLPTSFCFLAQKNFWAQSFSLKRSSFQGQ